MAAPAEPTEITTLKETCERRKTFQEELSASKMTATPSLMEKLHDQLLEIRENWVRNVVEIYDHLPPKDYMDLAHLCHVPSWTLTEALENYVSKKGSDTPPSNEGDSCQDTLCNDLCECQHSTRICVRRLNADSEIAKLLFKFQSAVVNPLVLSVDRKLDWFGVYVALLKKHYDKEYAPEIPKFLTRLRMILKVYNKAKKEGKLSDTKVIKQLQGQMRVACDGQEGESVTTGVYGSGNVGKNAFKGLKKARKKKWLTKDGSSIIDPTAEEGVWMQVLQSMSKHIYQMAWTDEDIKSKLAEAFYTKFKETDPEAIVLDAHSSDYNKLNYRELFDDSVYTHYENGLNYDYAYRQTHYDGVHSKHASAHSLPFDEHNQYQPLLRGEYNHKSGSESSLLIGGVVGASAVVIIMLIFCLGLAFGMIIYWGYSQKRALDVKRNKGEMRNWIDDNEDRNEV